MRAPRFFGTVLVFLSLSPLAFGQDRSTIPYVDLGTAQALVDTLVKENETLKGDSDRLRQEAATLTEQVTTTKKWINDLTPLLDEVRARNGELATVAETLVDRGLKTRSVTAADKNRAAEKRMAQRLDELSARVANLGKQIEARLFQVAVNEAKLGRNNDDLVVLQATLSKTRAQEARLQALVDRIDALSLKVDSALQQTVPAP